MSHNKIFQSSIDIALFDEYYKQFKENPESLNEDWRKFFEGFEFAIQSPMGSTDSLYVSQEFKVINLIDEYRKRGHLFTKTNPVRTPRKFTPNLDLENFGLTNEDLDKEFEAGNIVGLGKTSLRNIISKLETTYCSNIGVEFMYIRDPEVVKWITDYMDDVSNTPNFTKEEKAEIYDAIEKAVEFEQFIHRRFPGQKRFSLEGNEALIPGLQFLINETVDLGVHQVDIAMSHRGRLSVLANILKKPYENVFREFFATEYEEVDFLGDVKYHLGYQDTVDFGDKKVELNLLPNPSHLEAVGGVLQGFSRGNIDKKYKGDNNKLLPILIHGDAALASQGVVYELVQMSQLDGYKVGG
ncbi:MAG: 2-oxoglutarate dehydrogenase E1 component, partial [Bacteroidales bacterium]|nr:2-oxoglutarate dehydrogenase E1 component [Bacteroidales bacterium]